jgi:hypothetical protein
MGLGKPHLRGVERSVIVWEMLRRQDGLGMSHYTRGSLPVYMINMDLICLTS